MCFYIDPDHPKIKTASKDITTFKVVNSDLSPLINFQNGFHYIPGKPATKVELLIDKIDYFGRLCISDGYHSWGSEKKAEKFALLWLYSPYYYKCIIPEGTKYYFSQEFCEYISETIIITNEKIKVTRKISVQTA